MYIYKKAYVNPEKVLQVHQLMVLGGGVVLYIYSFTVVLDIL